jgi:origin recognition complex subunit 6
MPEWVMPAIRNLVKSFDFPSAAPHIFTGVESVLPLLARMAAAATVETPSKRPQRTAAASNSATVPDARIRALVIVISLYVFTRMQDQDITPEQYKGWRETALDTLLELTGGEKVTYDELSLETQELMPMAQEEGWLQMEWFLNVTPQDSMDAMEGVEPSAQEKSTVTKTGGSDYIGLGTMMQDATDYLSERRREDFKTWEAKIMARVQQIEAA